MRVIFFISGQFVRLKKMLGQNNTKLNQKQSKIQVRLIFPRQPAGELYQ
jgi:hypothetical protein